MVKLAELKQRAKDLGIKGVSNMRKAQLEELLKSKTKTIKVKKKKPEGGSKEEKPKRKRCPKGTRKDKESGKCLKKPSADVIDVAFAEPARRRIGKELDNLTAGEVVKDMMVSRIGESLSADDLTAPQILAMSILKLNVFTLNKWLELERDVAYCYHEENISGYAADTVDGEIYADENVLMRDPEDILKSYPLTLPNSLADIDDLDLEMNIYQDTDETVEYILGKIIYKAMDNGDSNVFTAVNSDDWVNPDDGQDIDDFFEKFINDGQKKYREAKDFLEGIIISALEQAEKEKDEDEEKDYDEIDGELAAAAVEESYGEVKKILDKGGLEFVYRGYILAQLDTEDQEEVYGEIYSVEVEGDDFVKASEDEIKMTFVSPIEDAARWTQPFDPFGMLADLTYGYCDIELGVDYDDDERFVDYYGFSFTRRELVNGDDMITIASTDRRDDIVNEMGISGTALDNYNRLLAISEGRRGKSP